MDIHELFRCCKIGDIGRVEYLVEHKEVGLNVRDKWDSTPLYYACLCGHEELVKYLLENGAKCESNTFDGERCVYGALTDEIRNILKTYKVVTAQTKRRDLYKEFLRRLLQCGYHHDVVFHIHGESIPAHRCILSARASYFAEKFNLKWRDKKEIHLNHRRVYPWTFYPILQFLYTGVLEADISLAEDVLMVAHHCRLDSLVKKIEEHLKKAEEFAMSKPGMMKVNILVIEPDETDHDEIQRDLAYLAERSLPPEFSNSWVNDVLPFSVEENAAFGDINVMVRGSVFECHQAFLCGRSDYLKALITDHFKEYTDGGETGALPTVVLYDIDVHVWIQILFYLYQDSCELTEENAFEVLCAADLYLLPGLKRQCASEIAKFLDTDNVVDILRAARLFSLPKLETDCTQFMADSLEEIVESEKFKDLVCEDAKSIKDRQEVDSVDIIDNLRSCLTLCVHAFSDICYAEQKLSLIDRVLDELGIDA